MLLVSVMPRGFPESFQLDVWVCVCVRFFFWAASVLVVVLSALHPLGLARGRDTKTNSSGA